MKPAGEWQSPVASAQTQAGPLAVMTHFEPPAQQTAGPPAAAWQTLPLRQQTPSAVGTVPSEQTQAVWLALATRPSRQQLTGRPAGL
jgi:hypothetical protein